MFKRLIYLITAGDALDELIKEEKRKAYDLKQENNRYRLDLCYKHRQEQNHSHFSPNNCAYCKLEAKKNALKLQVSSLRRGGYKFNPKAIPEKNNE